MNIPIPISFLTSYKNYEKGNKYTELPKFGNYQNYQKTNNKQISDTFLKKYFTTNFHE